MSSIEKLETISYSLRNIHKDLKWLKENPTESDVLQEKGSDLNKNIEKLSKEYKKTSLVDRLKELTQMIINCQWDFALKFVEELNDKSLQRTRILREEKYCLSHRNSRESEKTWWFCDRCKSIKKDYDKVWGGQSKEIINDCFQKQENSN